MKLERCPYDGTPITAEVMSGGSLLLSCTTCGAAWERHGAWIRRLQAPDREAVRGAREASGSEAVPSD
ncbi:MAG: hypothetical protein KatS3mg009_1776 [Acidimicrobiia bacterium]|nr:MAG: hypothetical protein KatS3mg009_1776 [Acidimicrobiia bacterium]